MTCDMRTKFPQISIFCGKIHIFKMMNDKQILFIVRYRNCAWGSKDEGKFVTSEGNVYNFNLVDKSGKYDHPGTDRFMQILKDISQKEVPSQIIDKKTIQEAYSLVKKIDRKSKMVRMHAAFDSGLKSLLIYQDRNLIPLATSGDAVGSIDSNEVDQILKILGRVNFYKLDILGDNMSPKDIREGVYSQRLVKTNAFNDF